MIRTRTLAHVSIAALPFALLSCGESEPASSASAPAAGSGSGSVWLLTSSPQGATSVTDAKASAQEGDAVVIRGRIGGRSNPITGDSPVFTIVDLGLPYCGQENEDGCGTPWDYCCETPDTINANAATVQLVDAAGNPISADLTTHGLDALDEVVVVGMVGARPSDTVLTVRATGVYVATE